MGGTYRPDGDYFLPNITLLDEAVYIGIWGQRHARYLQQQHRILYYNLLTSGKLNSYLADIDKQAEDIFFQLVKQMAEREGITEQDGRNRICRDNIFVLCDGLKETDIAIAFQAMAMSTLI